VRLRLVVRRCVNRECELYQVSRRPEQEGAFALPQGEFGLDVIALVGALRHAEHRRVCRRSTGSSLAGAWESPSARLPTSSIATRSFGVAKAFGERRPAGEARRARTGGSRHRRLAARRVGHEVLWVVRECLSGEVLLARSLLGGTQARDLMPLLREVTDALPVPVAGVVSDGQHAIRKAVGGALPGVPHQLCQFHYLREAAKERFTKQIATPRRS
jgi:hypothetical protein